MNINDLSDYLHLIVAKPCRITISHYANYGIMSMTFYEDLVNNVSLNSQCL